jgi:hypothetical protein
MLKEIKCSLFRESVVIFHEGLNVVLGDNLASNSIGKSTMLMIIDFVFGGDGYIKINYDVIDELNHHEFLFSFEFDNEMFYFIRSTAKYKFVFCCNKDYEPTNEIHVDEYRNFLKEKYKIRLNHISFREIVGLYSRIWGKNNYDIERPLHNATEKAEYAIKRLIKMYDKFEGIKALENQIEDFSSRIEIIKKAGKKNYLTFLNRTTYKQTKKRMDEIKQEIDEISTDILGIKTNYDAIVSKEVLDLREAKSILIQRKNVDAERLKNIKMNIALKNPALKEQLTKLKDFFPNIDINKLETIDSFHSKISNILKEDLKKSKLELEKHISFYEEQIKRLDEEIIRKMNLKNTPQYTTERLVELSAINTNLINSIKTYETQQSLMKTLDSARSDLAEIKGKILSELNSLVNSEMNELNKIINPDGRRPPDLQLHERRYEFRVFNDTGTGKAYSNLITLDLAILCTTSLPTLIHDTMLFKNIENSVFEHIVTIYDNQRKQIFISVDEVNKFSSQTIVILESKKVLQLSHDKTLFMKNWKIEGK